MAGRDPIVSNAATSATLAERPAIPIAVTIAGSDSGGGAGLQADLKTFSALGVYGASVVTGLTAQSTMGVQAIEAVSPGFVAAQLASVFDDLSVDAVKIGMLAQAGIVDVVAASLRRTGHRPVLDPVMVATSGDRLIDEAAVARLRSGLLPLARLLTPNLPEAAALLGEAVAADEDGMAGQARRLLALGPDAVLIKGGHAGGPESVDLLADLDGVRRFAASRIATASTHGTGCTLSSAIAARLAQGAKLDEAVGDAKRYLTAAIAAAGRLRVGRGHADGRGHGPVDHFHAWRDRPAR